MAAQVESHTEGGDTARILQPPPEREVAGARSPLAPPPDHLSLLERPRPGPVLVLAAAIPAVALVAAWQSQ